jgi:gluconolactonase
MLLLLLWLLLLLLHCADPPYGYKQHFRPPPEMSSRVYAFNPATGAVSVLAEDFAMCNGLAFSPDFKTLYVTDTGEESVSDAGWLCYNVHWI